MKPHACHLLWIMPCLLAFSFDQGRANGQVGDGGHKQEGGKLNKDLRELLDRSVETAERAEGRLKALQDGAEFKLLDAEGTAASLHELRAQMLAAIARVRVLPAAADAGDRFSCGDFGAADERCRAALRASPDDPYANYLAGLCCIELGDFERGVASFERVTRTEPQSRTAHLLRRFCLEMVKCAPQTSDASIVRAYDRARSETDRALNLPRPEGLAAMFAVPELLKDPMLYKIDGEGFEQRGPIALPLERLAEAFESLERPHERYLIARILGADPLHLRADLELSSGDPRLDGIDFLFEFMGEDERWKQQSPEFFERLAGLRATEPNEGLWLLLSIPYVEPTPIDPQDPLSELDESPLTAAGIELLERAVQADRLSLPVSSWACIVSDYLHGAGDPFPDRAEKLLRACHVNVLPFISNVVRYPALKAARESLQRGDEAAARRILSALRRLADRTRPGSCGQNALLLYMIRSSMYGSVLETALTLPGLAPPEMQHLLADIPRVHEVYVLGYSYADTVPASLPSPRIRSAFHRSADGSWENWEIARAVELDRGRSGMDRPSILDANITGGPNNGLRSVVEAGLLQRREVLPNLRKCAAGDNSDARLYCLIWALAELKDRESIPFLISCLNSPRPWLPAVAADALRKITGEDHGTDPAAWQAAPSGTGTAEPRP